MELNGFPLLSPLNLPITLERWTIDPTRLLITVRTYPNLSTQYIETVCTAGMTPTGEWRRLYPVPLRYLNEPQQFRTWDIVTVPLRPADDGRVESRRPNTPSLKIVGRIEKPQQRREWVGLSPTFSSIEAMKAAGRTIGPVFVREVKEFIAEPKSSEWTAKERQKLEQELLIDKRKDLEKLPFKFRLRWVDGDGGEQVNTFESWEVCQTWRSWRALYGPDGAVERMREKWLGDVFAGDRDLTFFMGNLAAHRNVFMVTGTFTPRKEDTRGTTSGTLF